MPRKNKYWWIKERHNPQFKKPYYTGYGNTMSVKVSKKFEHGSLYGTNYMHRFTTQGAYETELERLRKSGANVREESWI